MTFYGYYKPIEGRAHLGYDMQAKPKASLC